MRVVKWRRSLERHRIVWSSPLVVILRSRLLTDFRATEFDELEEEQKEEEEVEEKKGEAYTGGLEGRR